MLDARANLASQGEWPGLDQSPQDGVKPRQTSGGSARSDSQTRRLGSCADTRPGGDGSRRSQCSHERSPRVAFNDHALPRRERDIAQVLSPGAVLGKERRPTLEVGGHDDGGAVAPATHSIARPECVDRRRHTPDDLFVVSMKVHLQPVGAWHPTEVSCSGVSGRGGRTRTCTSSRTKAFKAFASSFRHAPVRAFTIFAYADLALDAMPRNVNSTGMMEAASGF